MPSFLVAGKYALTRLLGRGGMGTVWEGVHSSLGTRVAVKFIEAEYADSPEARSRFENEARAAATLRSKHVVEVYDHGVAPDGRPFIVMEYLDGEPLDRRLERLGRMSPQDTARTLQQVCRALAKAHAAGIVHRDLKPENVFLVWEDDEGADVAKVVDFGIAKFTERGLGVSSATRTGSVLGTPFYMSPEQARGLRSVDHRADLWSLGVITFRCIVGRLPFEGEAIGDLLVNLCTAPIPMPSALVSGIPLGFDAFIARALSRDVEQRFQSAQDFAEALSIVCGVSVRAFGGSGDVSGAHSASVPSPYATPATLAAPVGVTGAPFTQTPVPGTPAFRSGRGKLVAIALGSIALAAAAAVVVIDPFAKPPPASQGGAESAVVAPQPEPAPRAEVEVVTPPKDVSGLSANANAPPSASIEPPTVAVSPESIRPQDEPAPPARRVRVEPRRVSQPRAAVRPAAPPASAVAVERPPAPERPAKPPSSGRREIDVGY